MKLIRWATILMFGVAATLRFWVDEDFARAAALFGAGCYFMLVFRELDRAVGPEGGTQ